MNGKGLLKAQNRLASVRPHRRLLAPIFRRYQRVIGLFEANGAIYDINTIGTKKSHADNKHQHDYTARHIHYRCAFVKLKITYSDQQTLVGAEKREKRNNDVLERL